MKYFFTIAIIFAATFSSYIVNAQKFAFVDSEYILDQMESYQKAQKQIDDLSEKWQNEIKGKKIRIEGYLEEFSLSRKEADDLIMAAREIVYN